MNTHSHTSKIEKEKIHMKNQSRPSNNSTTLKKYHVKGEVMKKLSWKIKLVSVFATLAILFGILPISPVAASSTKLSLDEFRSALISSDSSKVVGVYVDEILAVRVVKQSSPSHVSNIFNSVTRFDQADLFGSVGLLAHNYLSGAHFSKIDIGTKINLVYGDGSSKEYTVTNIEQYQALSPDDPYSNFINLEEPDLQVSSTHVTKKMYGTSGTLVLQTCITKDGNLNWGRLFIIATPAIEE